MIVVECFSDTYFINRLLPREKVLHAFSKGNVLNTVNDRTNVVGLIDKDPDEPQPGALEEYIPVHQTDGMTVLIKRGNNTVRLIELNPRFENWIIGRAGAIGLNLRDFNLPSTAKELHAIQRIEKDPRFHRFIDSLIAKDPMMETIREVVKAVRV